MKCDTQINLPYLGQLMFFCFFLYLITKRFPQLLGKPASPLCYQ